MSKNMDYILENISLETALGQKKKYCFDYIREDVMKWAPYVRKNVTKQMPLV